MSGHTPGPWTVIDARTEGFCVISEGCIVIGSVDEYGHYGPIKNEADANLIASAPKMLKALEEIKRGMYGPRQFSLEAVSGIVDIAIAQAKGEL